MTETIVVEREALRRELARHRQEHDPRTGGSVCACKEWTGPFTIVDDERSFAEHLLQVIEGFSYTPFANPDCTTCKGDGVVNFEPCPDCIVAVWG
jgi:hypothetical protein